MKTFVGFRGILLTIMMTIVLCPSEKKRPHVTGSPSLIRLLVALSIALFTEVVCESKKDCYEECQRVIMQNIQLEDWQRTLISPYVICIQSFEFHWNISLRRYHAYHADDPKSSKKGLLTGDAKK